MLLHPLTTDITPPARFNNPFYYEPHPLCMLAARKLQGELAHAPFREEIDSGKMFGILVVEIPTNTHHPTPNTRLAYLQAYSGQIDYFDSPAVTHPSSPITQHHPTPITNHPTPTTHHPTPEFSPFVPAVFDYLQPGGYFKTREQQISCINHSVFRLEHSEALLQAENELEALHRQAESELAAMKQTATEAKRRRDERRLRGNLSTAEEAELTRESQFLKAELRRLKARWQATIAGKEAEIAPRRHEIEALKRQRKQQSDELQHWLFSQFSLLNANGARRNLIRIFRDYSHNDAAIPPSGSGECCEPKLLQYAYSHGLRPLCMAMFWWGASPRDELRRHLHFYPACNGKCKPLLGWMLQGLEVEPNALEAEDSAEPTILYEDQAIAVVSKPAGMLSVPGKSRRASVYDFMRQRYADSDSPLMVHRLDMATSGLLVVAKTMDAYKDLQRQFRAHAVRKKYVALLETAVSTLPAGNRGTISLPLRPDINDRPRQLVDFTHGKEAVTDYYYIGNGRIELWPHTGRTHQLRVHCAHPAGLNNPIKGDELYGHKSARLYLHAAEITFRHPLTGRQVTFRCEPEF
ncbi:RluA family pseudouridine synthase [Prevotella sp. kh1p2]|uniref:RluA family pseudouridine synthase n=1 Tax=Prevotella sp. kh1p2 TaxID=1761883 RepID=UPI0008AAA7E8|nr:RluA family pseudouridine synthase [Prevotella sp. kh1p2]SES90126.1 tRNA pseudouridine32 synthase / 23S rRNA pseudouridine746 synthase [Prevotella sp. kh1p2]SNU11603.1 tRNA pseudouridine32 synthase / 23S rRNA pseudouridine746 synthase [Prevotellaceae bacterium KH2P17]